MAMYTLRSFASRGRIVAVRRLSAEDDKEALSIKKALDLKTVPARTFTDAVSTLLKMTDKWELVGRSLRPAT